MRVTVSHSQPKEEVKKAVHQSFDDVFKGIPGVLPLQIVNQQRAWQGDTLNFSFEAKAGIISTPIKGFVYVTDKDLTIDADLGVLEKLLPAKKAREVIEGRVRGLLK
jgi:Putative polyhydroxyalkanoic acid system protein (PHA_gran_rgn)